MTKKIGETPAVDVELTTVRGVLMVVIREQGNPDKSVMFPAHQVGQIAEIIGREIYPAYVKSFQND
jgi:hypothetical protein